MSASNVRLRWCGLLATAIGLWPAWASGGDAMSPLDEGRELFERKFVAGKTPSRGDGLGPVFNHVSCVACHLQGGVGGAGPVDVNVQILSAQLAGSRPDPKTLLASLRALHPAFVVDGDQINPNIILHRFGLDDGSDLVKRLSYADLRTRLGLAEIPLEPTQAQRDELVNKLAVQPLPTALTASPLRLMEAQRNTTALFGAGLIDEVPDAVLKSLAEAQLRQGTDVTGRVPPIGPDKVGRFGWRGQTERLHDFVLGACSNELGLEVPNNPQPIDPFRPTYKPAGFDLTAAQCASLITYVAAIPPPKFVEPKAAARRELVARGREVFASVGCATCHVERIGPLEGVFSDLLLHDMGAALADPVGAAAALTLVKQHPPEKGDLLFGAQALLTSSEQRQPPPQSPPRAAGYYGSGSSFTLVGDAPATVMFVDPKTGGRNEFRAEAGPLDREWRTPPLWGVADSSPYLHDGRAGTLVEAIALHGGEAEQVSRRFVALPAADRMAMLEFLSCLRSPQP